MFSATSLQTEMSLQVDKDKKEMKLNFQNTLKRPSAPSDKNKLLTHATNSKKAFCLDDFFSDMVNLIKNNFECHEYFRILLSIAEKNHHCL